MTNEISGAGPLIDNPANITLSFEEVTLLKSMFSAYLRVTIKKEFSGGLSGSRVFMARPVKSERSPELPAVVKIAPTGLIIKEWRAYQKYVHKKLPDIANISGEPVFSAEHRLGGLHYTLMGDGGTFEVESLHQYYHHANAETISRILEEQLFNIIGTKWWLFNEARAEVPLQASYDFLLPVNLIIEPGRIPADAPFVSLSPDTSLNQPLSPDNYVQLKGFIVTETDSKQKIVTLNVPPRKDALPASYRLRLRNLETIESFRPGKIMPSSIEGRVVETRQSLLQTIAQNALKYPVALSSATLISPNDRLLPNPLIAFAKIMNKTRDVKLANIHGDLNLENILIETANGNVSLIDFATARRGLALHDLLRLETEIISKLVPEHLIEGNAYVEKLRTLYLNLHNASFAAEQAMLPAPPLSEVLEKPFQMLLSIRKMARQCLFNQDDWTEYYEGLTLYMLGAMKFKNLKPFPRQVAFWTAAIAYNFIEPAVSKETPSNKDWQRLQKYLPAETYQAGHETTCLAHLNRLLPVVAGYLPRHIALELLRKPVVARNKGEFLEGTLLFADISGFTAMSEKLRQKGGKEGAEEMARIINEYLDVMLEILFRYDGLLIKFGGDAMLGLFRGQDHGARAAVSAAWKMKEAMAERFAEIIALQEVFPLNMKIGSNSGLLFAAQVGNKDRMEYILTGSAVEQTARAEATAAQGDILISGDTYNLVKTHLSAEKLADNADFYRILALHSEPATPAPDTWRKIEKLLLRVKDDLWQALACLDATTPYLPTGVLPQLVYAAQRGRIEDQHRQATILFANFTGMSDIIHARGSDDAEGVTADLSEYFQAMYEEIQYYGGVVNKVDLYDQGDKLMVIFGAPQAHERDTRRAALTALAMQKAINNLSSPTAAMFLSQRIGIHTGFVFAGTVGSVKRNRREYTVMGDTVNLAARLMSAAEPGQILLSEPVWEQTQNDVAAKKLSPIKVKGINKTIPIYQLQSVLDNQPGRKYARTLHSELVGRDNELELLRELFDNLTGGIGKQIIAVVGEGGVGKTRLIAEWRQQTTALTNGDENALWLKGQGYSYGQKTEGILIEILEHLLGFSSGDTQSMRWNKLSKRVKEVFADGQPGWLNDFSDMLAYLGHFLTLNLKGRGDLSNRVAKLKPEPLQMETRLAICNLLSHVAQEQALVLILEDLHWADNASLDLLKFILEKTGDDLPILFCLIYREQKERPVWQAWQDIDRAHPGCEMLKLKELGNADGAQLLFNLLQNNQLPGEFLALINRETDGNPLYVEETLHTLIEEGAIEQREGAWQIAKSIRQLQVPPTLYQIIQSRIDELDFGSPGARRALWMAAVIGEEFGEDVWLHLFQQAGRTKEEFLAHLRELRKAAMIQIIAIKNGKRAQRGYRFRHGLVRQVAYENMPGTIRRKYHCEIGHWLEEKYDAELERHFDTLAYHYSQGRKWDKAIQYHLLAGSEALKRYAAREAINHFDQALAALDALPEEHRQSQINAREGLGDAYNILGEFDTAISNYQKAFTFFDAANIIAQEKPRAANIARRIGRLLGWSAEHSQALAWMDKGLNLLDEPFTKEARPVAAMLKIHTGSLYYSMGRLEQAEEQCRQGLDILAESNHLTQLAEGYNLLGVIYDTRGDAGKALPYYEQSIAYWGRVGDAYHRTRVVGNLGTLYFYQGDLKKARIAYEEGLAFWQRIGQKARIAQIQLNLGSIYLQQGLWNQADQWYQAALAGCREINNRRWLGQTYTNLGSLNVEQEDWEAARRHLEDGLNILEAHDIQDILVETYRWLAELACGLGDVNEALARAQQGLALAEKLEISLETGANRRVMGKAYRLKGDNEQAETWLEKSLSLFNELGYRYELAQTHLELARLYKAQEKPDRFKRHRAAAADIFSAIGAQKGLENCAALG